MPVRFSQENDSMNDVEQLLCSGHQNLPHEPLCVLLPSVSLMQMSMEATH